MQTRRVGISGEEFASKLLESEGYKIIERNFSCKLGEIDIIATKDSSLVFVEVKTRRSNKYGKPEEAVTLRKIQKIERCGEFYMKFHSNLPKKLRIDVVSIEINGGKVISSKIIPAI